MKKTALFLCLMVSLSVKTYALDLYGLEQYYSPENDKTISMDFTDANLNDVLKIFSQQSGLNFVASTNVSTKTVNLYLDKVPVKQALERILQANGLTYELSPESNIFIVKNLPQSKKQIITRVYRLKHATVPSSSLNQTLSEDDDEGGGSSEEEDSAEEEAPAGIIAAITAILTEQGSIVEDARTNSLIVSDIPSQFILIESTIARLDIRTPQVLIEVEMLDISKNSLDLLGAKWGKTPITFQGAEKDSIFPFNFDNNITDWKNGDSTLNKFSFFEDPSFRVSTLSFAGLQFALNFLRTQTDTKNLARPRILTLDNETAEIQISTDEAIGLLTNSSGQGGSAQIVEKAERVKTGIFLTVTPQVNLETSEITMAIEPKVIEARLGGFFGSTQFKDPEARGTKSILRILDGDTIIIGGLLRTSQSNIKTKVPILSKIPLVGAAFRHKNNNQTQRELIIFITPHILKETTSASPQKFRKIVREQDIPQQKLNAINKDLSKYQLRR